MTDMRKAHYWTVGFSDDPNTTEVEVAGRRFLAIPYSPIPLNNPFLSAIERQDVVTSFARKAGNNLKVKISIDPASPHTFDTQDSRILALSCKRPNLTDVWKLDQNIDSVCAQLNVKGKMMLSQHTANHFSDLPVLRPDVSSTMRVKTVYLFARRR